MDGLYVLGTMRTAHWVRGSLLMLLGLPLLATGPCLTTAEQSIINGFFDAVTPLLIERFAEELGVSETVIVPVEVGETGSQTTAT